jgi:hypothetical protein
MVNSASVVSTIEFTQRDPVATLPVLYLSTHTMLRQKQKGLFCFLQKRPVTANPQFLRYLFPTLRFTCRS